MNCSPFEIHCRESRGNLHVQPRGPLDAHTVLQLIELLHERYEGTGLVFVDTGALEDVHPQAADTFKASIESDAVIPMARLVFKGIKGFDMAPEGCSVLIIPKKRCCRGKGNCSGCDCHSERSPEPSPGFNSTRNQGTVN